MSAPVTSMAHLDENRLLLGFKNNIAVHIFDLETDKLTPFPININEVNHILIDKDGNIWFSTEIGLFKCPHFFFESYRLNLGVHDEILNVLKDNRQNIWFSASKDGFWRADKDGVLHKISVFSNNKNISQYYGHVGISEDSRGRVFLSYADGIAIYDPLKGNPNNVDVIPTGRSWYSWYDADTDAVYFGGRNESGANLNILQTNGDLNTYHFGSQNIMSICRDGNRKLRLGTLYGEAIFDEDSKTILYDTIARPYKAVVCMTLDNQGTLWKGAWNGLFAEDKNGNIEQITDRMPIIVLNYHNRYN